MPWTSRDAVSTQFHPEFTPRHMETMIRRREEDLIEEQRDPGRMIEAIREAPHALVFLRHILELILDSSRVCTASIGSAPCEVQYERSEEKERNANQ